MMWSSSSLAVAPAPVRCVAARSRGSPLVSSSDKAAPARHPRGSLLLGSLSSSSSSPLDAHHRRRTTAAALGITNPRRPRHSSSRRSPFSTTARALNDSDEDDGGSAASSPSVAAASASAEEMYDNFQSPSGSFHEVDDPAWDAEIEALAAARDKAAAAAAAAQRDYVNAVTARDAPPSASADEAETLYNASPYVNIKCEYGYIQSNAGMYIDISKSRPPGVPKNILAIAAENFTREWAALRAAAKGEDDAQGNGGGDILVPREEAAGTGTGGVGGELSEEEVELMSELRDRLGELELSNDAIWDRERARPEVPAPWIIKVPYYVLCYFLDAVYPENRPIQRFWFLETVARMPYFSYNTMLTIYELLGWWRRSSELRRVHFAEEWNEYHHLLIHESLGGDRMWRDRPGAVYYLFLAQHSALLYYVVLIGLWLVSPALAYNFSELIELLLAPCRYLEAHAVDTYAQFAEQNKDALRQLPAPRIAKAYYESADLYLFDEFQTARPRSSRRPKIRTLYDTFVAIRDDEGEHVATMKECQMEDSMMADVEKVNLGTAAVVFFIGANYWLQKLASSAGLDALEMDGVDAGEMLGEDGLLAGLLRLLSFLPFL